MELFVKHFSELTAQELYEIYRLRVSVFVVEQKCCYQEVDDAEKDAYHVWLRDEDGIEAYGIEIVENVPIEIQPNEFDYRYLQTKKNRMGHTLHL